MASEGSGNKESKNAFGPRRQLPKLLACMAKKSLDNMRNQLLFNMPTMNANQLRRSKNPLHLCLMWEMEEQGYVNSAAHLRDLITDNIELVEQDEIGIVVDLRKNADYLNKIQDGLKDAERAYVDDDHQKESLAFLALAMYFSEMGKGILWLAEKFFLASIAVSSQVMVDGGRQAVCCKYYYSKFLLDKFPTADTDEPYEILSEVRDTCIGKTWRMGDDSGDQETVFAEVAIQLHRVLLTKARTIRRQDPHRADRLCRMAERRAKDTEHQPKLAEAITELGISQLMTNDLNNALRSFERALAIQVASNNTEGICEGHMHVASALQRLGDYDGAAKSLSMMGTISMENSLRRQLGRALHLLGEVYLRRSKPELATPHLREAFNCFMGDVSHMNDTTSDFNAIVSNVTKEPTADYENLDDEEKSLALEIIHEARESPAYTIEAEQSRLMMAISSGQEKMASYFRLLIDGGACAVSRMQIMEWKLHNAGWWVPRHQHDLVPCMCQHHQRSPLDVLRLDNVRKAELVEAVSLDKISHASGAKHMYLPAASYKQVKGEDGLPDVQM